MARKNTETERGGAVLGRPSSFTEDVGDVICERLACGESLRSICRDAGLPNIATVLRWLGNKDERYDIFRDQYARAREVQADTIFDEILDIADETSRDTLVDKDGKETVDNEWIARSRLRIDARKWMAGKLRPKRYGDKQTVDLGNKDGAPLQLEHRVVPPDVMAQLTQAILEKPKDD